jgi:hypothetical protein
VNTRPVSHFRGYHDESRWDIELMMDVNAIYRFVTMVYKYNYHNFGQYPPSSLLFITRRIGDCSLSQVTENSTIILKTKHFGDYILSLKRRVLNKRQDDG